MSVIGSNILAGASGQGGGYNLTKSLRFRSSASAYLSRTPASAGNRRTWTWSAWVKRGAISSASSQNLFSTYSGSSNGFAAIRLEPDNTFYVFDWNGSAFDWVLSPTQVFRDPSAWYHIVVAVDTTQATSSNRVKIYVNGIQVTAFSTTTYPTLNLDTYTNSTQQAAIGSTRTSSSNSEYFDGYLAEVNFVNAQQLTPSSFGETSTSTGVWIPKKYTGTYGTNGFYLPFTDTTSTSTLGTDFSGNSNTWTVNGISLTSGSTYDSMTDVPTLTSATTANYCVLNPLTAWRTTKPANGNMEFASGSAAFALGTMLLRTGKWYCEVKILGGTNEQNIGFVNLSSALTSSFPSTTTIRGSNAFALYSFDGKFYDNGTASAALATFATDDIVMLAYDADNSKIYVGRNGTWLNSAVPASGTGAVSTTATAPLVVAAQYDSGNATGQQWNFGQRPFTYTPPTGFVALNTYNISAGTITTSGSFTGNAATDGPFIYLNGVPTAMTINGNAVTFGTHADKLANGFKVRSSSSSYNASGSNTYSISTTSDKFKYANAQPNP